ncbi:MAG: phosphotransferase family protein [Roseitalea sp.]|jgi:thiamine kinase-like enzyme|nr:phosphotransferase family protein [Roseitalea sp.]MBO6720581.1 phosphotransferase family protein [Roseitalea sp.]MBO6743728.1 phosphotransferase family protein [Roseitalea sp.]
MLSNSLNAATTPADRALSASLAKIKKWSGMTVTYERVGAGYTNFNFLVHIKELELTGFAKVVGPGTEAFIDRKVAHEAAVLASDLGIGPSLIGYVEEDDFEVYEFLKGYRCFTIADMTDPDLAGKVMNCYAKMHAAPALSGSDPWDQQIGSLVDQIEALGADRPDDLADLLWQKARAKQAIGHSGTLSAPCYNDGYVTNYMRNDAGDVRIIDWEYGANNDPYWDLATYFFECFADRPLQRKLLDSYNPAAGANEMARIDLFIPLVCLKWGLWASLQSSISKIDFDYLKYADILFMRARHLMRQEGWEIALDTLWAGGRPPTSSRC